MDPKPFGSSFNNHADTESLSVNNADTSSMKGVNKEVGTSSMRGNITQKPIDAGKHTDNAAPLTYSYKNNRVVDKGLLEKILEMTPFMKEYGNKTESWRQIADHVFTKFPPEPPITGYSWRSASARFIKLVKELHEKKILPKDQINQGAEDSQAQKEIDQLLQEILDRLGGFEVVLKMNPKNTSTKKYEAEAPFKSVITEIQPFSIKPKQSVANLASTVITTPKRDSRSEYHPLPGLQKSRVQEMQSNWKGKPPLIVQLNQANFSNDIPPHSRIPSIVSNNSVPSASFPPIPLTSSFIPRPPFPSPFPTTYPRFNNLSVDFEKNDISPTRDHLRSETTAGNNHQQFATSLVPIKKPYPAFPSRSDNFVQPHPQTIFAAQQFQKGKGNQFRTKQANTHSSPKRNQTTLNQNTSGTACFTIESKEGNNPKKRKISDSSSMASNSSASVSYIVTTSHTTSPATAKTGQHKESGDNSARNVDSTKTPKIVPPTNDPQQGVFGLKEELDSLGDLNKTIADLVEVLKVSTKINERFLDEYKDTLQYLDIIKQDNLLIKDLIFKLFQEHSGRGVS